MIWSLPCRGSSYSGSDSSGYAVVPYSEAATCLQFGIVLHTKNHRPLTLSSQIIEAGFTEPRRPARDDEESIGSGGSALAAGMGRQGPRHAKPFNSGRLLKSRQASTIVKLHPRVRRFCSHWEGRERADVKMWKVLIFAPTSRLRC